MSKCKHTADEKHVWVEVGGAGGSYYCSVCQNCMHVLGELRERDEEIEKLKSQFGELDFDIENYRYELWAQLSEARFMAAGWRRLARKERAKPRLLLPEWNEDIGATPLVTTCQKGSYGCAIPNVGCPYHPKTNCQKCGHLCHAGPCPYYGSLLGSKENFQCECLHGVE